MMPLCLLGLTTEMKDAFLLVVRLVALYQVKKLGLIVAQVLEQWGVTQTQKTSLWSVVKTRWRCFQLSPTCATTTTTTSAKEKKRR